MAAKAKRLVLALAGLAGVLGLIAGALLLLGHGRWGGAWWYFPCGPDYRLRCGQEALRRGDLERTNQVVLKLEEDGFPDHAHLLRGQSFLWELRYDQAIQELNQIPASNEPLRVQAGVVFGLGFLSQNRLHEAEQFLRYVVSKDHDNVEAHRGLASIYFDQGAKGLAVIHAREWARLAPRDGMASCFLGVLYSDFGDSNSWAADAFREALRRGLSPEKAEEVKLELAEVLVKQTQGYGDALRTLDELAPEQSQTQRAFELRAECLWGLGLSSELESLLAEGLARYPKSNSLLCARALTVLAEDPKAALAPLELAVRLDPHDRAAHFHLAQAYELLGRRADAMEQRRLQMADQNLLEEMSELSKQALDKSWDAAIRIRLAEICDKLEKPVEAAMWRKAAANCPPPKKDEG
jgi:tetratricopeptide (TPR) repeat protein